MEPHEYFKDIKSNLQDAELESFNKQISLLGQQIIGAQKIGQKSLLDRLAFTYKVIQKEQQLYAHGITKYLLKDDILKFLGLVVPKNSIKIIELDRFPRPIPLDVLNKIEEAKKLEIFDDFLVIFSDFTEQNYETPEERALVARNRDPVVFGWFKNDQTNLKHDRVYFIADWIDDYCDLNFTALIQKMSEKIEFTDGDIMGGAIDWGLVNQITDDTLEKLKKGTFSGTSLVVTTPVVSLTPDPPKNLPEYDYIGVNNIGNQETGSINAENKDDAITKLRKQGIFPTQVVFKGELAFEAKEKKPWWKFWQ